MDTIDRNLLVVRGMVADRNPEIERFEERLRVGGEPTETAIILVLDEARAYYVSKQLELFDRELRRTAARWRYRRDIPLVDSLAESLVAGEVERSGLVLHSPNQVDEITGRRPRKLQASRHGTYPLPPQSSSLRLVAAEPGSSNMLLEAAGFLITILASQPMTAVANAAAWSGPVRRVRGWFAGARDPLHGVTARQALTVLSLFGGEPQAITRRPAEQTIDFADEIRSMQVEPGPSVYRESVEPPQRRAEAQLHDGTVLKGRRITVIQDRADGSRSIYTVES